MDFEKLKKIPVFKNVDFEDPRSRKRVAMAFLAVGVVLITILLMVIDSGNKDKKGDPKDPETEMQQDLTKNLLDIPEGHDNDGILRQEDMLKMRQNGISGNERIFRESSSEVAGNPLAFLDGEDKNGGKNDPSSDGGLSYEEKKRRVREFMGFGQDSSKMTPEDVTKQEEKPDVREEKPERTTPATRPRREAVAQERPQQPSQPKETPRQALVRRSSSVSSLDDEWGTIEGISSLDTESQYIVQDDDHPYKVMFTKDQKIQSGERISLRLLEDMAVDGILIPKNTHLSATCRIGERLEITVNNIEINGKIYSLNYIAFDNDGSQGLYCPQSQANRNAKQAKGSAGNYAAQEAAEAVRIASSALGVGAVGSMASSMTSVGANAVLGRNGNMSAQINAGYTFYLLKDL